MVLKLYIFHLQNTIYTRMKKKEKTFYLNLWKWKWKWILCILCLVFETWIWKCYLLLVEAIIQRSTNVSWILEVRVVSFFLLSHVDHKHLASPFLIGIDFSIFFLLILSMCFCVSVFLFAYISDPQDTFWNQYIMPMYPRN